MTPDGLPIIGPLPGKDNVLVASGHCMLGVTLAPITAEVIAAYIKGGRHAARMTPMADPFSPRRFVARRARTLARSSVDYRPNGR